MLDRTVPYCNLILRCDYFDRASVSIPDGYSIIHYHCGLQSAWAKLEKDIGDFSSEAEAESYFTETYLPFPEIVKQRALFLTDPTNNVIGSCIAWHGKRFDKKVSSLHWLVVEESHHGKGLGRVLFSKAMNLFDDFPVYIHTQPWSWKAILLYLSSGFKLQKKDTFDGYENQYETGITVLQSILPAERIRYIIDNTES